MPLKSSFDVVLEKYWNREGNWSANPRDPGGLTILGISKRHHETSEFYKWFSFLAGENKAKTIADIFEENESKIKEMAKEFYLNFWEASGCVQILQIVEVEHEEHFLDLYFDTVCHKGVPTGVRWLQIGLNALRHRADWELLATDGVFGPRTFSVLKACMEKHRDAMLMDVIRSLRIINHLQEAEKNNDLMTFLYGWLRRDSEVGRPGNPVTA